MSDSGRRYTVRKRSAAEIDAATKASRRSLGEALAAQWPGFAGLGMFLAGFGYYAYVRITPPHILYFGLLATLFAAGIALLGYWGLAN